MNVMVQPGDGIELLLSGIKRAKKSIEAEDDTKRLRKLFWRGVWGFILTAGVWVLLLNATADLIQWLRIFGSMLAAYAFSLSFVVDPSPGYFPSQSP